MTGSYIPDEDPSLAEEFSTWWEDPPHHVGWNRALKDALDKIPTSWYGQTLSVSYEVWIKPNPGSVGEYKAHLGPGG